MQSLAHQFLTFCRSKPADEEYNFSANNGCAFAQFLIAAGYSDAPWCSYTGWNDKQGNRRPQPDGLEECLREQPRTFGALAERLAA